LKMGIRLLDRIYERSIRMRIMRLEG
jgi:hypothetical protein